MKQRNEVLRNKNLPHKFYDFIRISTNLKLQSLRAHHYQINTWLVVEDMSLDFTLSSLL